MQFHVPEIRITGQLEKSKTLKGKDLVATPPPLVSFNDPVQAYAKAQMTKGDIYVAGWVRTHITFSCARCLEIFKKAYEEKFAQTYTPTEDNIDVLPELREALLINLPIKPLCRPECKVEGIQQEVEGPAKKKEGSLGVALKNIRFK